jgi:helicase MOV-10
LPSARSLIVVNSNSACDEIGDRLLKYIGHNKVFRYYSPSFERKMERVHSKLRSCSNLRYGYHVQPSIQEMMSYHVVICTLVNSGRLLSNIPTNHFDFVIIDEAASCAEAFVSIPLSLTMSQNTNFKASIVLAGDHKQLGQIMRTHFSEVYGFQISIMERVMEMPNYKFDEQTGYNANYITQLTDNFRSHEAILDFSNKNFYNSILKAKQDKQIANFAVGWEVLPNKKVPLIFQASWIPSEMDGTSHYNNGEVSFVKYYVGLMMCKKGINGQKIAAKNIGIISPYAVHRELLKKNLPSGIEIGTVEYFQGREKLIIILSCVRSKTKTVGFLNNEKRLNVALTRAKGLLIVIGNPETLGKNKMWRRFITNCSLINATVGKIPSWVCKRGKKEMDYEEDSDEIVRLEEFMNGLAIED